MRNALVRFGKRSSDFGSYDSYDFKRNGAPQPFVRFGRSVQQQPTEQKYYVYSLADLMPNAV
ncbi:neuropeptide precursor AFP-6 [Aphelenchoides avenae]|nr:neuropeptide precursor AFP-6 [Aphelenchus avenae]